MPMRYRKLRIAWSVVWGLLALAVFVLWVRSYWWQDCVMIRHANMVRQQRSFGEYFLLASQRGRFACLQVLGGMTPFSIHRTSCRLPAARQIETLLFNEESHGRMGFYLYWFSATDCGAFAP